MRAREAAKQDQLRARHRLSKFLLRHGRRAPAGVKAWTQKHEQWIKGQVHFEQPAQEYTMLDYLHEVEHMDDRIRRLEQAIEEAVKLAPPRMQKVIQGLQALRGIAQISAVTIVAELGEISRFGGARQLMSYSGAVSSEHSSGKRIRRGQITKTGNAHLRRIAIEAAWSYRHRPASLPRLVAIMGLRFRATDTVGRRFRPRAEHGSLAVRGREWTRNCAIPTRRSAFPDSAKAPKYAERP